MNKTLIKGYVYLLSTTLVIFAILLYATQKIPSSYAIYLPIGFLCVRVLELLYYFIRFHKNKADIKSFFPKYRYLILVEYSCVIFPLIKIMPENIEHSREMMIPTLSLIFLFLANVFYRKSKA